MTQRDEGRHEERHRATRELTARREHRTEERGISQLRPIASTQPVYQLNRCTSLLDENPRSTHGFMRSAVPLAPGSGRVERARALRLVMRADVPTDRALSARLLEATCRAVVRSTSPCSKTPIGRDRGV